MDSPKFAPFFTFHGNAEEALNFYASILPGATIESVHYFTDDMPGDTGKLLTGILNYQGSQMMFMDMQQKHDCPAFTWSTSFVISIEDEQEYDSLFEQLAEGGVVMMKQDDFLQYRKVAWVTDRYGITWQPVLL